MENNKNRFSKSIAFNSKNEVDQQILKHVKRRNFSGYVKKLILADMKKLEERRNNNLKNDSNGSSNN